MLRVGRIPYINCFPVYGGIDRGIVSMDGDLVDGIPTALNRLMAAGRLDVSVVSAVESARDASRYLLLPEDKFSGFQPPPKSIPNSIGHWSEWAHACKTGSPTTCNFDYSGALTETILLGIVAFRTGEKLEWDAAALKARNSTKAEEYLTKTYRKGWEVFGLS